MSLPQIVGIIRAGLSEENAFVLAQIIKCIMHESLYTSRGYVNDKKYNLTVQKLKLVRHK